MGNKMEIKIEFLDDEEEKKEEVKDSPYTLKWIDLEIDFDDYYNPNNNNNYFN